MYVTNLSQGYLGETDLHISPRGLGTETVPRTWNTDTQAYQKT